MAPIIDVHAHWYPPGCLDEVARGGDGFALLPAPNGVKLLTRRGSVVMPVPPGADDLPARLATMDAAGIDVRILSLGVIDPAWLGAGAAAFTRRFNDTLAEVCRQAPGRLRFVAALPLDSRGEMVVELDRALALGAVGVGLTTTVGGRRLDAAELQHFWRAASERGLTVLVHPTFPPYGPDGDPGVYLRVGYPGETALAAARLALSGVLEECPGVHVVWSHLGGTLPMMLERLDRGYDRLGVCPRPPTEYLKACFYDTVTTHGPALECARATFGAGALLFGTDDPHVPNGSRETLALVRNRDWPATEVQAVLGDSARRLFGGLR